MILLRSGGSPGALGSGGGRLRATASATAAPRRPRRRRGKSCTSCSRRGSRARQMAERIARSTRSQSGSARLRRASPAEYLAGTAGSALPAGSRATQAPNLEGFLFPATYAFTARRRRSSSSPTSSRRSAELGAGRPRVRALEEPDAVRRADHRVDDREGGARAERAPARGRRDLQPPEGAHAARDRRDDPLRARRPADRAAAKSQLEIRQPVQHTPAPGLPPTPIATPGSPRCRPPRIRRRSTTSTSCASPTRCTTSSPRASASSTHYPRAHGYGCSARRGSSRSSAPGRALAVAADAERRLRGARPRLGVRPLPSPAERLAAAVDGLAARLRGRERDGAAQARGGGSRDAAAPSVNTLVFRDGRDGGA